MTTTTTTPARHVPHDHDRQVAMTLAEQAYHRFAETAATVREDQWLLPTDCAAWDIRTMCGHVLGAMRSAASIREMVGQQREIKQRVARDGGCETDVMTQVQVERTADLSAGDLVAELSALAGPAARGRRRTPVPMRRLMTFDVVVPGLHERWTWGYLVDVVLTRDAWLHRIDLCRALGVEPQLDPLHDGAIVAGVAREWGERHGRPVDLVLDGPAGGRFGDPDGEPLRLDAVEFCRVLSGRAPASGLLEVPVPF